MASIIRVAKSLTTRYLGNVFFKRFVTILGVDILVKTSGFLLLPVFLRLMSQEEFGLYNYFLSIIQTFSLVLNMGLYISQTKLYHTVKTKEERGHLFFTITIILLSFISMVCIPIGVLGLDHSIVGFLFKENIAYKEYREIVFLALVVTVFSFMLTNFFYTTEKIKEVKIYNVSRIVGVNLISVLALFFVPGDSIKIRLVFGYGIEIALFIFFSYSFIKELIPVFDKNLMKQSLRIGLPIMISSLFGIVVNFSDKFLLQNYSSLADLSNYYLAFSFASIIALIFNSFQNVWLPIFMKEKSIENSVQSVSHIINKLLLFFIPISVSIWVAFELLIGFNIIPFKYRNAGNVIPLMLTAQLFAAFAAIFSNYLVYFEKTKLISFCGFIVSIFSIGMGVLLVPTWGIYGAAISSLAANILYFVFYYFLSKQVINRHTKKSERSVFVVNKFP